MDSVETLVFDTGPLSHFAQQGWLGVLKAVVAPRLAVIPDMVAEELRVGALHDYRIQMVLDAGWIERRVLQSPEEISAFATFAERLVRQDRNWGEAAVLALAATSGGVAVLDDGAARQAAKSHGIALRPTLALVCEAIRSELLTVRVASALADDLLASSYRLPMGPGGFEKWATDNNLI
jgi:predicted nucleic acid-binding protein